MKLYLGYSIFWSQNFSVMLKKKKKKAAKQIQGVYKVSPTGWM